MYFLSFLFCHVCGGMKRPFCPSHFMHTYVLPFCLHTNAERSACSSWSSDPSWIVYSNKQIEELNLQKPRWINGGCCLNLHGGHDRWATARGYHYSLLNWLLLLACWFEITTCLLHACSRALYMHSWIAVHRPRLTMCRRRACSTAPPLLGLPRVRMAGGWLRSMGP